MTDKVYSTLYLAYEIINILYSVTLLSSVCLILIIWPAKRRVKLDVSIVADGLILQFNVQMLSLYAIFVMETLCGVSTVRIIPYVMNRTYVWSTWMIAINDGGRGFLGR